MFLFIGDLLSTVSVLLAPAVNRNLVSVERNRRALQEHTGHALKKRTTHSQIIKTINRQN